MPQKDDGLLLLDDPLWYKDAVIYEIPVRAFFDSNGDGIGDLQGLVQKLDYVRDLGATAIWLLPFYPSPQRDGGYDIADYRSVHPQLGTLADFRKLLHEAHRRGIRVITELVINHTSVDHPWFQRARRSPPGSRYRDYYVWSDTPERYPGVRIIFQDFETSNWTWDPVARAYYWHRFYHHQPDLNFDNPAVRQEILRLVDFWFELGVDGMRLDAIPYLYEREGTNCENLPETHTFLKELRRYVDARYRNRMFLAEANQWPEDAAAYFGDGDECHMNFHFPLMPRMFMAVQLESSFPIVDILAQTPRIPETCQWAVFLRNHDELTLEMVTDEDRDYMWRVYAEDPRARVNLGIRRRLAPLLKERARIELMNALLFSMPGTPVLYYGDEIGMGDNVWLGDRDGVRTPMQWSADRNAGFSTANPQQLYLPVIIDPEYHYMSVNVEAQNANTSSLLWWTRRMIAVRKQYRAFGRGDLQVLHPENGKVLAFLRTWEYQRILVVANLSRHPQVVELDLSAHAGLTPLEIFGRTPFPVIGHQPYVLTLGPYGYYWFSLETVSRDTPARHEPPVLDVDGDPERALLGIESVVLASTLVGWLRERRWFRGRGRALTGLTIVDRLRLDTTSGPVHVILARAEYREGSPETYVVPLAAREGERAAALEEAHPDAVVARLRRPDGGVVGIVADAMVESTFAPALLACLLRRREPRSERGARLVGRPVKGLSGRLRGRDLTPHPGSAEQSNQCVVLGDTLILKLLRVLEAGVHPEEELGLFLTERRPFPHVPRFEGAVVWDDGGAHGAVVALVHELVPAHGDAWSFTLDALRTFVDQVRSIPDLPPSRPRNVLERASTHPPAEMTDLLGAYLPLARLLGQRTAELHLALADERDDPAFAPEPLTLLHQRSMYQSARTASRQTLMMLRRNLASLDPQAQALANALFEREEQLDERLRRIHRHRIDVVRIRVHGDLHLGQVLYTNRDFVFIDFEGEPARSLGERRFKRTALRDVAGLLRSFRYAAGAARRDDTLVSPEEQLHLVPWLEAWADETTAVFLRAWLERVAGSPLVPEDPGDLATLLDFHLIEKAIYELRYELGHRPDWISIPLRGLLALLEA